MRPIDRPEVCDLARDRPALPDGGRREPTVAPPQLDKMGLGFRVPFMVISPWAKHHYVSHVQHEFGSIVKFTETAFDLPSLHTTDDRSDALRDCFDFTQKPPPFKPIPAIRQASFFEDLADDGPADTDY